MLTCHVIQGVIHDIGLLCGSAPSVPVTLTARKQLYTIYRYLNVVHILCMKSFSPSLRNLAINPDYATRLKLLTDDEAILVSSMDNKARDGVLTLLTHAVDELLDKSGGKLGSSKCVVLSQKVCKLRSNFAKLHDLFVRDNPNEYLFAMRALVFCYEILVVLGYPFLVLSYSGTDTSTDIVCIQPAAFTGAFFILLSLNIPFVLFESLQNPFAENGGIIVDNLMASSEMTLFQNMRCLFHLGQKNTISVDRYTLLRKEKSGRRLMRYTVKGDFGEL